MTFPNTYIILFIDWDNGRQRDQVYFTSQEDFDWYYDKITKNGKVTGIFNTK